MNNLFIYKYIINVEGFPETYTIIFLENKDITKSDAQSEIRAYFERNIQTDKIIVIGGVYLNSILNNLFIYDKDETFKFIPKVDVDKDYLNDCLSVYTYDVSGDLISISNKNKKFEENISLFLNEGLVKIFIQRGGLIESHGSHHFVFPSGKHCDKFLRTGNILLYSSEIYFIAFCLLKFTKSLRVKKIFCDTSSINTLAFALQDLKKKLDPKYDTLPIESFSSYEGILKADTNDLSTGLILVSSSTSANIVSRIIKRHSLVQPSNILVLFFLGDENVYREKREQIICNLTYSDTNKSGITQYDTYSYTDCIHCESGSHAIEIRGDVFLLEKPKVNPILIDKPHAPNGLSKFMNQFRSTNIEENNVLKVNYKEGSKPGIKYDIYIDFKAVIESVKNPTTPYSKFREKLYAYIDQYIPSNTVAFITLNDEGSKELTELIHDYIKPNYVSTKVPEIITQDEVPIKLKKETKGSIVVVASCISNGKNLLYLSRALRNFSNARLVYFIGLARMKNPRSLALLKSNLKYGKYGLETNSFIEILNINCDNEAKNTTWQNELTFLKRFKGYIERKIDEGYLDDGLTKVISERISLLERSENSTVKGLANKLFYPKLISRQELELRKGFAFFDFENYHEKVSQADVYFTISNVLNNIRKCRDILTQTEYVRNLIDPNNFNRYNDGIIQASILRSAHYGELSYDVSRELSEEMKNILETMIKYHTEDQGEALTEFVYSIAVRKLTLRVEHLKTICDLAKNLTDSYTKALALFIEEKIIPKPKNLASENIQLKMKIEELEEQLTKLGGK